MAADSVPRGYVVDLYYQKAGVGKLLQECSTAGAHAGTLVIHEGGSMYLSETDKKGLI